MIADEMVLLGSREYYLMAGMLVFARGMDFLSTWIATPNLVLEANPLARKLGWRGGLALNVVLCASFALWPLPAIVVATTSVLVAARNFQSAWLMRTLGEESYRSWMAGHLRQTSFRLYLFCLLTQTLLLAGVGAVLMIFSQLNLVPLAVGMGIVAYAVAVTFYTLLSVWRIRRASQ